MASACFELESVTKSGVLTLGAGPQLHGALRATCGRTSRGRSGSRASPPRRRSTYHRAGPTRERRSSSRSADGVERLHPVAHRHRWHRLHLGFLATPRMGDLGVRYHHNGLARGRCSRMASSTTAPATPRSTPTTSEANFLTYRIGVVIPDTVAARPYSERRGKRRAGESFRRRDALNVGSLAQTARESLYARCSSSRSARTRIHVDGVRRSRSACGAAASPLPSARSSRHRARSRRAQIG